MSASRRPCSCTRRDARETLPRLEVEIIADAVLYLFDGYNLLHARGSTDVRELVDELAGFVAMKGAAGVVVFDGAGEDREIGALDVRYAANADSLLERLAADNRDTMRVLLVSSDAAVRGTAGQEVGKIASSTFLAELERPAHSEDEASRLRDRVDEATREKLERLRRGLS
jgi:predicted RNA-binding protein with PIN domain